MYRRYDTHTILKKDRHYDTLAKNITSIDIVTNSLWYSTFLSIVYIFIYVCSNKQTSEMIWKIHSLRLLESFFLKQTAVRADRNWHFHFRGPEESNINAWLHGRLRSVRVAQEDPSACQGGHKLASVLVSSTAKTPRTLTIASPHDSLKKGSDFYWNLFIWSYRTTNASVKKG